MLTSRLPRSREGKVGIKVHLGEDGRHGNGTQRRVWREETARRVSAKETRTETCREKQPKDWNFLLKARAEPVNLSTWNILLKLGLIEPRYATCVPLRTHP